MTDFIISDLHVPYQDQKALSVALKMIQYFRPNNVIMNGDMLDCVQLSRFNKEPLEPSSLAKHVEELCQIIRKIQRYSNVIYVEGNHEQRVQKYINDRAPELHGLISIERLFDGYLRKSMEYVRTTPGESMMTWNDDLLIGHFNKAAKNTCYTVKLLVEKYMTNVVQAHTHRLGEYAIRGYDKTLRGWECGCLCDLDPDYVAKPNWQQGFLVYTRNGDGWNMEIVHIEDGRALFRGKVYKA
jgi:UDP-2,3-diacylglucosamine pyrophosphatase LpxH